MNLHPVSTDAGCRWDLADVESWLCCISSRTGVCVLNKYDKHTHVHIFVLLFDKL